jgi:xylulokinase
MSLLGIDVGTTGCKAAVFSAKGQMLSLGYEEYDFYHPQPGWAQIESIEVWQKVKAAVRAAVAEAGSDPVSALSVSSLGESVVPVRLDRQVLGPSLLNFDIRGAEFVESMRSEAPDAEVYLINGNTIGNQYGMTKLMWLKHHQPDLYQSADKFLLWASFIQFMLGAEPVVDYALANRMLLFDLDHKDWSPKMLRLAGLEASKLPSTAPCGTVIGKVSASIASELGLPARVEIVLGTHDQCANALGCGVIEEGLAVYGMGTYICITPVFKQRLDPAIMIERGLNTQHHAVPRRYVSFIYNQGGSLVKWYRNTFAGAEYEEARQAGRDIYADLISEIPDEPGRVLVVPHFAVTGPPAFITGSSGVLAGLRLETQRGEILRGILEGTAFYIKECIDSLPGTRITIEEFRAVGGGARSDAWIQLSADIMGRPIIRPKNTEAGALGAALIAGVGTGIFPSFEAGVAAMVAVERVFEPEPKQQALLQVQYERYKHLWPLMEAFWSDTGTGLE